MKKKYKKSKTRYCKNLYDEFQIFVRIYIDLYRRINVTRVIKSRINLSLFHSKTLLTFSCVSIASLHNINLSMFRYSKMTSDLINFRNINVQRLHYYHLSFIICALTMLV